MNHRRDADHSADPVANRPRPVDLAHTANFQLGRLEIRPSLRQAIRDDGVSELLEPRVMQVLIALAQAEGRIVTRTDLTYLCWEDRIVGEDAISRVISRLRKFAEGIAEGQIHLETITKVGYRLLVLSPPGETSPQEARAGAAVVEGFRLLGVTPARRYFGSGLVAACAIAAAGAGIFWFNHAAGMRREEQPRLVLLQAFDNSSGGDAGRALAAALPATLLRDLVGTDAPVRIVETLPSDVTHPALIIRGNTAGEGSILRANVELIAGADGTVVWSGGDDRPKDQTDALVEQLSLHIARELYWAFARGRARIFDRDPEAIRLSLAAADMLGSDFDEAARYSAQLVARAPDFARGWAEYATNVAEASEGLPEGARRIAFARVHALARRALSLDPREGLAYFALAETRRGTAEWIAREAIVNKGLRVDPDNPELNAAHARDLAEIGRLQDALGYIRRSFAADHFLPGKVAELVSIETDIGDMDDAHHHLARGEMMWPGHPWFDSLAVQIALYRDDGTETRRVLDGGLMPSHRLDLVADRAFIAWRQSPSDITNAASARAIHIAAAQTGATAALVQQLAMLGRIDEAYRLADQLPAEAAVVESSWYRDYLAPFRADPRFMQFARRLGWVTLWQKTGLWPDFCVDHTPYDCRSMAAPLHGLKKLGKNDAA